MSTFLKDEHESLKTYQCEFCNKGFQTNKDLSKHKTMHGGIIHSCKYCAKSFSRFDNLNTHIRKFHKDMEEETETSTKYNEITIENKTVLCSN